MNVPAHPAPADEAPPQPQGGAEPVSIVIPVFNEEDNIRPLLQQLFPALQALGRPFEVIAVDDGSRDGSLAILKAEAAQRPELKVIAFSRNYGQTAAMMAGFDHARGAVIVPMDADLQNDPADIPVLLAKLEEGYDIVSGWRRERKDARLRRSFVSRVANAIISRVSGVRLHDYGCTLKAYRRSIVANIRLYGEMHRFIPIHAARYGARIAEVVVRHHPRRSGQSKYGLNRIFKVILDLIVVIFFDRHLTKPIYTFGGFGLAALLMSAVFALAMLVLLPAHGAAVLVSPLPMLALTSFLAGALAILMGLLAELVMRTYFEAQRRAIYHIRETRNLEDSQG
jgi:glycosyltransferase involved in cell wall biosynthesis